MNLYLRYFDNETLVSHVDEAIDFLRSIQDINVTPEMEADIRDYAASDVFFPKRYKVRAHVYFIIIKTVADTMLDFKQKKGLRSQTPNIAQDRRGQSDNSLFLLTQTREGWYEGALDLSLIHI